MTKETKAMCQKQGIEPLLMSQFADGSVTLHIPDRDTQDYTQTAHGALQFSDGYVAATTQHILCHRAVWG